MRQPKPILSMFAAVALMAGMTVIPATLPQATAQISFHLGWQQPPNEYNQVQQQGFHAGIDAARHDIDHGLSPDPHRHGEFRRPEVQGNMREDFRHGFQHGYEVAYQHRGEWDRHHHDWGEHGN
jgi:hypothetical protein